MTAPFTQLVCVGGTLCDDRLFGQFGTYLDRPATIWNPVEQASVNDAARALLGSVSGKFSVLGFSLGGFVALEALRQAPERIASLILISGNAFPDDPGNADTRRSDVDLGAAIGLGDWIISGADRLVPAHNPDRDAVIETIAAMAQDLGSAVHARQAEMNIRRPDFRSLVREASLPILAIAGSHDGLCPQERYSALGGPGHVTLEMIDGAGHYLPLEAPQRCAALVRAFLQEHNP